VFNWSEGALVMLTEAVLRKLWPNGNSKISGLIEGIVASAPEILPKYGIVSPLLLAHFMAQISHECGAGLEVVENLNYTAARIVQVWPSRFSSVVAAAPYAHNPEKLANKVYNGRMGNREGSDDGWSFRGMGATQVTGRENYARLADRSGLDLLSDPNLVNSPGRFLECGAVDYVLCGCLPFAAKDDIVGETRKLNGGLIGLDQRRDWLRKWKDALRSDAPVAAPAPPPDGALRYGDTGFEVKSIQERLTALGYFHGEDDGDFGPATRAAVLAFQADEDISTDGVVGQATREALAKAQPKPLDEDRTTATVADLRDSGSKTVEHADAASFWGRLKMGGGALLTGGGLASQVGSPLDTAQQGLDKVDQAKTVLGRVHDMLAPAFAHLSVIAFGVVLIISGVVVCYFAEKIRQARLADHQSGAHLGR